MDNKQKVITLIVAFILMIGVFTGCVNSNNSNKDMNYRTENNTKDLVASNSCTVICQGSDENGNDYKLVGKQEETYDNVKIEVGVIKNKEWIVHFSTDSPFITESGCLIGGGYLTNDTIHPISENKHFRNNFKYVANGCFSYYNPYYNECKKAVIYNVNTQKYYEFKDTKFTHLFFVDASYANSNFIVISKSLDGYGGYLHQFSILNTDIMEEDIIVKESEYRVIGPYSEGLFAVGEEPGSEILYFYDVNGKQVLDVTQYGLNSNSMDCNYEDRYFKNGEFRFTQTNSAGTKYNLAIDTNGKIIQNGVAE